MRVARLVALIRELEAMLLGYMQGNGSTPRDMALLRQRVENVIRGK